MPFSFKIVIIITLLAAGCCGVYGQRTTGADDTPMFPRKSDRNDGARTLRGAMTRLRIEKEKRAYDEMIERAEQIVKISEQLADSADKQNEITQADREQFAALEKLTKKVMDSLGGNGNDIELDPDAVQPPADIRSGILTLKEDAAKMLEEVKKTTRFTVTTAAIESSGVVLKIVRYLKLAK